MPTRCRIIDTYESIDGVRHAVEAAKRLRERGYKLGGIRLDSGDLAYLSIEARKILNASGFKDAVIVGSNDLNEHLIASLKQQGAAINVWGVGTMLVTAYDQPALGGVYKLSAIRKADGTWDHRVKLSEQTAKVTNPGVLQVRRFWKAKEFIGDAIYDETRPLPGSLTIVDPIDATRRKHFSADTKCADLLVPILKHGKVVYDSPSLDSIRARAQEQLSMLHAGIKRFDNPHQYPAGLELTLHQFKTELILRVKGEI